MNVLTDKLVREYKTEDPFELAERMDITVHYHELLGTNGYYLLYKGKKNIVVNKNLERHLQKFIVAHEIGHSVLHPDTNAFLLSDTLFPTDRQEIEADKFAINLLLPDSLVQAHKDRTIDDWASILGLPREILELRF